MLLWNKRSDEPARWYARFEIYRSLGPNRTIEQTYQLTAQAEGLKGQHAGGQWYLIAKTWDWKARAEAYDAHERERLRALEEDRRFDAREQRLGMIDQLLTAVFNVLAMANLAEIDTETARSWLPTMRMLFKDLIRAQREEFGPRGRAGTEDDRLPESGQIAAFSADELAQAQRELHQHLVNTGGGAYVEGSVTVHQGHLVGRDKRSDHTTTGGCAGAVDQTKERTTP